MKPLLRGLLWLGLLLLAWPEFSRYRGEYLLAQAASQLDLVLSGKQSGAEAVTGVERAHTQAAEAALAITTDARPALLQSLSLMLLRRGDAAQSVLLSAIGNQGERPELSLNLGRARAQLGDEAAAQTAFLRTAWAAPASLDTLPKAVREALQDKVAALELKLRAGQLQAPPPLQ